MSDDDDGYDDDGYDANGFQRYTNAEELIASERRREVEVRARFQHRIASLEHIKNRLERATVGPIQRRGAMERELQDQEAQMTTLEEALAHNRRRKQVIEQERDELADYLERMDHWSRWGRFLDEHRRPGDPLIATHNYAEMKRKGQETMRVYAASIERFQQAIRNIESQIESKRLWMRMLTQRLARQREEVDNMVRVAQRATYSWQKAVDWATKTWPRGREEREMIYLEDLRLFLEDKVPDTVNITPPGLRDDSRVQTANGPYIALSLVNNPSWGRLYIQTTPEGTVPRFQIHTTTLPRGLQDIPENLFIELTNVCYTERKVASIVRKWVERSIIQS